jgi:hypothetical protein
MGSIEKAIEDLKLQDPPLFRPTARKYRVHHETLQCHFKGIQLSLAEYYKTRQLLSIEQEKVLVNQINMLSERRILPTNTIVKSLAFEICKKQPGKNWAYEFIQRHNNKIASVMLEGFDLSRKKADNYTSIKQYFDLVCHLYIVYFHVLIYLQVSQKQDQYRILLENYYNIDEKGFIIGVLKKTKRVVNINLFKKGKLKGAG